LSRRALAGSATKSPKATTTKTPYWPAIQQWCTANDLPLIGYHYVTTNDPASQAQTWLANNGGPSAMLDWETNSGDLTNLTAVVNAFNTAGITIQLGYYPQWYWNQHGGGNLSDLANALASSAYPDGTGYASTIYANSDGDTGTGWAPYGNTTPAAWQYTDHANIASHTVDCNAYPGNDLTALFGAAPAIAPAPSIGELMRPPSARHE
jgi:hypothetical protein